MNINILIFIIGVALGSIYLFFKPLDIKQVDTKKDIPLFEVNDFTMYDISKEKVVDISTGKKAFRYKDRYKLNDFALTDNSNEYLVAISANEGLYKNEIITLEGDVVYSQSDGLEFKSQKVFYNRKKGYLETKVPYIATQGESRVVGSYLYHDINKKITKSKNVDAIYIFNTKKQERK